MTNVRHVTSISCEIPVALTNLDKLHPFTEPCVAILVNPQGCALRIRRAVELGTAVRLEGLPTARRNVVARVVNSTSFGEPVKFWVLGLALDEPGNVWGVVVPPDDWPA